VSLRFLSAICVESYRIFRTTNAYPTTRKSPNNPFPRSSFHTGSPDLILSALRDPRKNVGLRDRLTLFFTHNNHPRRDRRYLHNNRRRAPLAPLRTLSAHKSQPRRRTRKKQN
jgi:hypothetical protein